MVHKARSNDHSPPEAESVSFDEATERYPWEWILLKVTRIDDQGVITHGQVIAHNPRRDKISKSLKRLWQDDPEARAYIFLGGTRRVSGDEFRSLIAEAGEREYVNARW